MSHKFTSNCLKFSYAILSLLVLQTGFAQSNKKTPKEIGLDRFAELDGAFTRGAKSLGNDVVAMVWTDTLVYKHELGSFDSKTPGPLGAASSWLTTALVLKFVDEGKISLDDKVSQYLPIFETYGKAYITIRHCLSNYTGIQSESGLFSKKKFGSLEDEVNSFAKKEIKSNAGTEFSYNLMGPSIAGRVLEVVSKKKFDMLIKQQLFNPLAMRKTTFSNLDGSAVNPASGGQSSADEFMHFLKMILNKGQYNGTQILSENAINEFRKIHSGTGAMKAVPKGFEGSSYALGSWVIEEGKNGMANAEVSPGMQGTWALVDWCRNYAFLVQVKSAQDEPKKEMYNAMKDAIDDRMRSTCQ